MIAWTIGKNGTIIKPILIGHGIGNPGGTSGTSSGPPGINSNSNFGSDTSSISSTATSQNTATNPPNVLYLDNIPLGPLETSTPNGTTSGPELDPTHEYIVKLNGSWGLVKFNQTSYGGPLTISLLPLSNQDVSDIENEPGVVFANGETIKNVQVAGVNGALGTLNLGTAWNNTPITFTPNTPNTTSTTSGGSSNGADYNSTVVSANGNAVSNNSNNPYNSAVIPVSYIGADGQYYTAWGDGYNPATGYTNEPVITPGSLDSSGDNNPVGSSTSFSYTYGYPDNNGGDNSNSSSWAPLYAWMFGNGNLSDPFSTIFGTGTGDFSSQNNNGLFA